MEFVKRVYSSHLLNSVDELKRMTENKSGASPVEQVEYRLTYRTKADFRIFAKKLEIMEDFRVSSNQSSNKCFHFMVFTFKVYWTCGFLLYRLAFLEQLTEA